MTLSRPEQADGFVAFRRHLRAGGDPRQSRITLRRLAWVSAFAGMTLGRAEQTDGFVAFEEVEQQPERLAAGRGEVGVLAEDQAGVVTGGGQQLLEVGHGG